VPTLSAEPPIVELRGVGKTFGNATIALDDLNLDIRHREFISLLGPSGCGKSTALRLMAGLSKPTRGSIEWSPAFQTGPGTGGTVGFVFQEPTLMPWATVFANVHLPLRLQRCAPKAAQSRAMSAIEQMGLGQFAQAYPRELSGGMKMRVSIARALVTDPGLLLLDEPFAALDEITRFRLNNDLLALWQSLKPTVVFVTHSVFESVYLSNRVVVLTGRPGRVFAELAINAPYPRDESFRTSPEYSGYCREVSQALAAAMAVHRS